MLMARGREGVATQPSPLIGFVSIDGHFPINHGARFETLVVQQDASAANRKRSGR